MGTVRFFREYLCLYILSLFIFISSAPAIAMQKPMGQFAPKCSGLECVAEFIEHKIRPAMQSAFKNYYDAWGAKVSELVWVTLDQYEAENKNSDLVRARYPAFVKKTYEKYVFGMYRLLKTVPIESIDESLQTGFDILSHANSILTNVEIQTESLSRVQRAVKKMSGFVLDPGMRECLRGHIIDVPIENAFNTGCHIFITANTVEFLSDDELLAVVSHEMGHSARGDGLDNFKVLLQEMGKHAGLLILDEANWFLTGQDYEHFKAMQSGLFLELIIKSFGVQAERIELMADLVAVKMLHNSGRSPEHLVTALIKLVAGNSGVDDANRIRKYPSLQKRIEAIRTYAASL